MNPDEYHSPATHPLRYDEARFKASHNSYVKKKGSIEEQLTFNRSRPKRRGFRGLELDIHQDTKGCEWCVRHLIGDCLGCLESWLGKLLAWSVTYPDHDVVTVTLDLKKIKRPLTFADDFDATLKREGFHGVHLFTPAELKPTGWPTLGALKGKFVLCLSGSEKVKAAYARETGRLCFADVHLGPGNPSPPANDPRLFLNYNWREYEAGMGNVFVPPAGRPYVIRAYSLRKDPAMGSWSGALRHPVNIMATDWLDRLGVGAEPFARI